MPGYYTPDPGEAMRRLLAMNGGRSGLLAAPVPRPDPPDDSDPLLVGRGPVEASTCVALEGPLPLHIWDVNGYYRDLGVHPRATRKELMRAYQAHGNNPSARVTYVFKQLLETSIRRAYDLMPLGEQFIDQYVMDEVHRQVKMEMSRQFARNNIQCERDIFANIKDPDYDEILNQMGFRKVPEDNPGESLDTTPDDNETPKEPAERRGQRETVFAYSYYLWRSKCDDHERLARWQEHLISALVERGIQTRIAVGYLGRMAHPMAVGTVGTRVVVFLNEDEVPDSDLAHRAADRVVEAQARIRGTHPASLASRG